MIDDVKQIVANKFPDMFGSGQIITFKPRSELGVRDRYVLVFETLKDDVPGVYAGEFRYYGSMLADKEKVIHSTDVYNLPLNESFYPQGRGHSVDSVVDTLNNILSQTRDESSEPVDIFSNDIVRPFSFGQFEEDLKRNIGFYYGMYGKKRVKHILEERSKSSVDPMVRRAYDRRTKLGKQRVANDTCIVVHMPLSDIKFHDLAQKDFLDSRSGDQRLSAFPIAYKN